MIRSSRFGLVVALAVGISACAPTGAATEFVLENATNVPVQVVVDGTWVGTYASGTNRAVPAPGEPPHRVEVLTASGERLVEWGYDAGEATSGATTRADLPCGVVRLSVGRIELPALTPTSEVASPCP